MANLCSMASLGKPSGFVLHQEQSMSRVIKECVPILPSSGVGQSTTRSGSLNLRQHQFEEPWKPMSGLLESSKFVQIDSIVTSPMIIDMQVQDACPNSLFISYGIAENCSRHEKISQYLMSGSNVVEEGLDLSLLSELMGVQIITNDSHQLQFVPPFNYPSSELHVPKPLVDFMGDLALSSKIMVHPDGRILLTGTGSDVKDLLSLVADFYASKDSTMCRKHSLLVPYFDRLDGCVAQAVADVSSLKLEALAFAPLKSPEKTKLNPSQKKKRSSRKLGREENDLYKTNSSRACESLLSLMVDWRRNRKTAIHSLKTSGPELPELLTQFSAGIAGTGLAVLFSVISRVACARVPFCASKLFSTGFGLGLVWLAWSVNRLRNTIVSISKNSNKSGLKEEDVMRKVDSSVKEIYIRAATLMAFAILRLA